MKPAYPWWLVPTKQLQKTICNKRKQKKYNRNINFVYLAPWKVIRIAESWKFLHGIMDFGIRNPANYEILESRPFEIWNTLRNLGSKMVSDQLHRLKVSIDISYFQVSRLEQANVFQTLEYSFRDRVITTTIDSVMNKIVLFFFFFSDSSKQYIAGSMISRTSMSHCITGSPSFA